MLPRAAIFDLDGTLADSAALHAQSWRRLASELGVTLDEHWFKHTFGRANKDIIPDMFGQHITPDQIAAYSNRKEELYREIAATDLRLFAGARELLQGLQTAGWRLAIGSSTPCANLAFTMPLLELTDLIEVTVGMEDVTRHKPEPDTFLEAARRLGVPPARCLVFEDAPAGIEAARRGGMAGVAVTTHHPVTAFEGCVAVRAGLWEVTASACATWLEVA